VNARSTPAGKPTLLSHRQRRPHRCFGENAALKEVRIHPTEEYIVHGRRPRLSVPRLAEPDNEKFKQVIERTRERSKPFGTRIEIRDGMGVARPG